MKAYHGTSIGSLVKMLAPDGGIYVTDTAEHASRYANAQATHVVSADYKPLVEGAAIVELDVPDQEFWKRSESHSTLDAVELWVKEWKITNVILRFYDNENTTYGRRGYYMKKSDIQHKLAEAGISVTEVTA